MKRTELKKVLKPLIKECIKEVIFEEGVLSGLVSEVVRGVSVLPESETLEKTKPPTSFVERPPEDYRNKLRESKEKIREAIGQDAYNGVNLFEGTEPLKAFAASGKTEAPGPLDTYAPGDSGVDISSLPSSNWKRLV